MVERAQLVNLVRRAIVKLERERGIKSVKASIETNYAGELHKLAASDEKDSDKLKEAIIALLLFWAFKAYYDGMQAGGVEDPEGEATASDRMTIDEWIAAQTIFALGLAQAMADAKQAEGDAKIKADAEVERRLAMWAAALMVLRVQGLASAQADMMVTWKYGETEHCDTCLNLNGQQHRLSWFTDKGFIPREPGSATLKCGGYNCQCGLYDRQGNQVM